MTTRTDLVAMLEAAEAGSRELDAAVWLAATGEVVAWPWGQPDADGPWCVYGNAMWTPLAGLTTSLDAALALAERVLPGWRRHLNELPPSTGLGWEATVWTDAADLSVHPSRAPTAPLALCIAVLRATAAAETGAVGMSEANEPKNEGEA